jgi:hypothetical protein
MMYAIILIGIWFLYVGINILLAEWHNSIRLRYIRLNKTGAIKHGWWAFAYAGACFIPYLFFKDWWFVASISLLHLAIFSPAYNLFSKAPSTFYLSPTTTSIIDQTLRSWGLRSTETINILALAASLVLLMISFF